MQPKRHMTLLIKLSSKFPSWKTFVLQWQKFSNVSGQTDVGNREEHLR